MSSSPLWSTFLGDSSSVRTARAAALALSVTTTLAAWLLYRQSQIAFADQKTQRKKAPSPAESDNVESLREALDALEEQGERNALTLDRENVMTRKKEVADTGRVVGLFWDYDNCAPPKGSTGGQVVGKLRQMAQSYGTISTMKAYLDINLMEQGKDGGLPQEKLLSQLADSGVSLVFTPKSGRKNVADQRMITDLMAFAIDNPAPATLVVVSGDRDFSYTLGTLRNRRYEIVLVLPPVGANVNVKQQANKVLMWRADVLGISGGIGTHALEEEAPALANSDMAPSTSSLASPKKRENAPETQDTRADHKTKFFPDAVSPASPSTRTPDVFAPLIETLNEYSKRGITRAFRKPMLAQLAKRYPFAASSTGLGKNDWMGYLALAESIGIIQQGSMPEKPGSEWVWFSDERHHRQQQQLPLQQSPLPQWHQQKKSVQTSDPVTKPSGTGGSSTPSTPFSSPIKRGSDPTVPDNLPFELQPFLPLLSILEARRLVGDIRPLCSYVGAQLGQLSLAKSGNRKDVYAQAHTDGWKKYAEIAQAEGLVKIVETDKEGILAVRLKRKWVGVVQPANIV